MADDTKSTVAKPLTFSDAMSLIWSAYWLASKVSAGCLLGWLSGGATGSIQAMPLPNGNGDTENEKLVLVLGKRTITVTVT